MNDFPDKKLDAQLAALEKEVRETREYIHSHPELSLKEFETTNLIESRLRDWGYEPFRPPGLETGAVAVLKGGGGGKGVVALRADIDALPIREETGLPYASKVTADLDGEEVGVMHACGHDGHTAVLLGVARALKEFEADVPGTIVFVFQPGEEGGGGGRLMVEGGVLEDPPVQAIFAHHCRYALPTGMIELSETPNASTDAFEITVRGRGGHAAYPHTTVDPIPVAAQVVGSLQTLVSRKSHPARPAVVTVGCIEGGTTYNVIPDVVRMKGTVRTLDPETRNLILENLGTVVRGTAEASGAEGTLEIREGYPPVRCDRGLIELVRRTAGRLFGPDKVRDQPDQTMGGEDFAYYLEDQGGVPGVIFRVGVGGEANQHTPRFDYGAEAILPALKIMAHVAVDFLQDQRGS